MKVGDMIKLTYSNAHWVGWVVELLEDGWAVIWRPEHGFQTWSHARDLESHYQIEVIDG